VNLDGRDWRTLEAALDDHLGRYAPPPEADLTERERTEIEHMCRVMYWSATGAFVLVLLNRVKMFHEQPGQAFRAMMREVVLKGVATANEVEAHDVLEWLNANFPLE